MKLRERGFTLVEVMIVMSIISMGTATVAPKAIEAQKKAESGRLQEEFNSVTSARVSGDITHGIILDGEDMYGNKFLEDYTIPISPSAAFQPIWGSGATGLIQNDTNRAYYLYYGDDTVYVDSSLGFTARYRHSGRPTDARVPLRTKIPAVGISHSTREFLSPIFQLNDTKLHKDFVRSPHGLNLLGLESQLNSPKHILSAMFGGRPEYIKGGRYPGNQNVALYDINVSPIELTLVDTELLKESSSGKHLKTLTNKSKGSLYQVTSVMSRNQFIEYTKGDRGAIMGLNSQPLSDELANEVYERFSSVFTTGDIVFIPESDRDIIYSTQSDLKYGYYVQ